MYEIHYWMASSSVMLCEKMPHSYENPDDAVAAFKRWHPDATVDHVYDILSDETFTHFSEIKHG